jgi:hypothetical protein
VVSRVLPWFIWLGVGAATASAAIPCADEPGTAGLACRTAELVEAASGLDARVERRVAAFAGEVTSIENACASGDTKRARRGLRALRRIDVRRALDRAAARGAIEPEAAASLLETVRLVDALRRATDTRLVEHACPELVEILRPADGELVPGAELFILLRLAAEADPTTLAARLDGVALPLPHVSSTQAWARVPCNGAATLEVTVRDRGRAVSDTEAARLRCGSTGFALGTAVDVLIDDDHGPSTLRLTPVRPLRSGATYAAVVTRGLRTLRGEPITASADFRSANGLRPARRRGPRAHWSALASDAQNPFPSERLVRADGTVIIPDGFTARALPADARLDGVRAFLRRLDAGSEKHAGFSPHTPIVFDFDAPIALDSATAEHVFVVEIGSPGPSGTNLRALLDALGRERGIASDAVAVATVFPVEDVAGVMAAVRAQIIARAMASPPDIDFTDPDPTDARRFGLFHRGDAGFAEFFDGDPPATVGTVARASFLSPDYRAEGGRFPARFLDGSAVPPDARLEFLLALPAPDSAQGIAPPYPVVILQHGFAGDDTIVTQLAGPLTAAGLAAIGIPAPEHGPRGHFLDFFNFDDFNAFGDNWRQSSVDLLQLVRVIEHGLDLDGDAASDVDPGRLGYLGVSLGGVIGGVFTAIEPDVTTAVLNVPGGRLSQLTGASSPFAEPFLARFAAESGIPVRVCGGAPTAAACAGDADCAAGETCRRNPDFTLLLEAATLDWQTQLDPGDGSAYARALRLEPSTAAPRAVLVQEGIGDMVVANPLTEALARAIALPADRADEAPDGVAGLWRFPPPTGHGILGLPEVRAQAITFLATRGRTLASP